MGKSPDKIVVSVVGEQVQFSPDRDPLHVHLHEQGGGSMPFLDRSPSEGVSQERFEGRPVGSALAVPRIASYARHAGRQANFVRNDKENEDEGDTQQKSFHKPLW